VCSERESKRWFLDESAETKGLHHHYIKVAGLRERQKAYCEGRGGRTNVLEGSKLSAEADGSRKHSSYIGRRNTPIWTKEIKEERKHASTS